MNAGGIAALLAVALLCPPALAQGVRSHTRNSPRGTAVSADQAVDLTLTVTPVAVRPIQVWLRIAGRLGADGRTLTAYVPAAEGGTVKPDQRARAFPVESRSSMFQARVASVRTEGARVRVDTTLIAPPSHAASRYVVEIVTDRGDFLSIPNEAIIEEGEQRIVYVQRGEGRYEPQPVTIGLQGELFTEVVSGLNEGDQVVTFGSFFIDSEYKLKGAAGGR